MHRFKTIRGAFLAPSLCAVAALAAVQIACAADKDVPAKKVAVAQLAPGKAATTQPANNHVTGTVTLTELPDGKVHVVASVSGFEPGSEHGIHIHEKPDLSGADLMSTGGHYNPEKHVHGGPTTSPVHAGDFGNIKADESGNAALDLTVDNISLGGAKNDVLGLPIVVHAKPDDLKSQPAGNSGPRVAAGLIELQK